MKGIKQHHRGFTLIEMITVIVILGIIATLVTPFIAKAMQAYTDAQARANLVSKGRLAIERIAREVRHAVPNSLSVITVGNGIEFARSRAGGRYVERFDNFGSEFSRKIYRFRKNANRSNLYVIGTSLTFSANDVLVIANTSPALLQAGTTSTPLSGISATTIASDGTINGQILSFTAQRFLVESSGKHFSIVDQTVEVGLQGTNLHWFSAPGLTDFDGTQDWSASDPLLIDNISAINFSYAPGSPLATGVLRIDMQIDDSGGESIRLYHEVQIRNTP